MKRILVFALLIVVLTNLFSCGDNNASSETQSGVSTLYKSALGRLYNTSIDEFSNAIEVCDLSLDYYEQTNNVVLTLNNCQERLMMIDLLLVDEDLLRTSDEEAIINGKEIVFPYFGLEFSGDYVVLVPTDEEGEHELKLNYDTNELSTYLVLFSYFEDRDGFSKRIEHYLRFTSDEIKRIGDSNET